MTERRAPIDLDTRLALRIPEAAAALGLSEGCFRRVLPEIERVYAGKAVLIPVESLRKWLRKTAQTEASLDDQLVSELLDEMR